MPKFLTHIEGTENLLKQGSPEWRALRMGKATASSFDKVLTEAKGEPSSQAPGYARRVAIERVLDEDTEKPIDGLHWVERGKLLEGDAVKHYEAVRGRTTDAIGLIISDDGTRACSPDRISTDRLWGTEVKCPSGPEHLDYMDEEKKGGYGPGPSYRWQLVGSLLISEFDGWDFCSYHPLLKEVIVPYRRQDWAKDIETLDNALKRFEAMVQRYCDLIRREGFVDMRAAVPNRADAEWQKMLQADPGMWSIA